MKKLFLLIVCVVLSIGARAQFSGSGNGTEADPYRIYTDIHLAQMANFLNQSGVYFELMGDISLTNYINENSPTQGWTPIGVQSTPFKGVLKGNGHTISGLYIKRTNADNVGLFGYINGAIIQDLTIKGSSVEGKDNVGTFVGYTASSTLKNVTITVSGSVKGSNNVGGIVGYAKSTNLSDAVLGAKQVEGSSYVGGVIGYASGSNLTNADFSANQVKGTSYVGGVIGYASDGSIKSCNATCDVTSTSSVVGGVAGYLSANTVSGVKSIGNVSGTTSVGGGFGQIVGTNTLNNVNSIGDIAGTANVSGIAGELTNSSIVTFNSCFSKGRITNCGDYTGGIVGKCEGISSMDDCFHFGDIHGNNFVGGILGSTNGYEENVPQLHEYYLTSLKELPSRSYTFGPFYDSIIDGGKKESNIRNCSSVGNIIGYNYVGGIAGRVNYTVSYSQEILQSERNYHRSNWMYLWQDGICVGEVDEPQDSYYYVNISRYTRYVSNTSITDNYHSGEVIGNDYIGGLCGYQEGGEISSCYSYSSKVKGNLYVGGIVGYAKGHTSDVFIGITSNVSINSLIIASESSVGRIYGNKGNNFVNIGALGSSEGNRALTQTSVILCGVAQDIVDNEQNGTSVGPSMLKLKGNYVSWGWNFDNDWDILETESFPYKKYQAAPPVIKSTLESHDTSISGQSLNGGTVYMYYRDREAVSTTCNGHDWVFETDALQSGAQLQLYADVEGMTPSYLTSATVKYPGSGTEDDPWRIYTAEDLQGAINSGYYKVMNNIDLTSWINENSPVKGWPAIGRNSSAATYIDGDNHTISGLWIDSNEGYNGLFSNYSAGYIKNLNVQVAEGKKVKGGDNTAILIGRMANAKIINCSVKGDVEGAENTGGLVGQLLNSDVEGSGFQGKVTGSGLHLGGLTGLMDNCNVSLCYSDGTINSTNTVAATVGGLVGSAINSGSISKSFANTVTTSAGTGECGGLVGHNGVTITECYAEGSVTSSGDYTGGLVGLGGNISNCYSTASVTGTLYTAGLVGYTYGSIDKCYASGNVNGVRYGAGLVGEMDGADAVVTNSVAANNLVDLTDQASWGCRVIGGFKNGAVEPTLGSNYALNTMQVSLNGVPQQKTDNPIEGVAKTEEELKSASTYVAKGWDFEKQWTVDGGYPVLKMEADVEIPEIGGDDTPEPTADDTDISQFDDVVYVKKAEGRPGSQVVLSVQLNNINQVYGYQFVLKLPKGISVATTTDSYGDTNPCVTLTEDRTSSSRHNLESSLDANGNLTVLCYSTKKAAFIDQSGEVAQIVLNIADDVAAGAYPIIIKDEVVSLSDSNPEIEYIKSTLEVITIRPGDANGDSKVNVGDITAIAGYILGAAPSNFDEKGADANGDDKVNVGDITTIAGMILDGTANNMPRKSVAANMDVIFEESSSTMSDQHEFVLPVCVLSNEGAFSSFQFDVTLPEGFSLVAVVANEKRVRLDELNFAKLDNENYRVLGYSIHNNKVMGTCGAIAYLHIVADDNIVSDHEILMSNGIFANGYRTIESASVCSILRATITTGIDNVTDRRDDVVFDLSGRRVNHNANSLHKGVYIINGIKVLK